ncbi:hypothetical protein H0H92_014376 [Tricholoma furcatifolium]|nr:hypothetical protein H0H92_014376 [Tricholoma furcatifolium]
MSFSNIYYRRATATDKACYVCYKPTTTVLATIDTTDFLYTCPGHLADRGFATQLGGEDEGGRKMGLTEEEIAKVKEEWEEKQRRKKEKEEDKEKEEEKDKEKEEKEAKDKDKTSTEPVVKKPTHERYALHRDFFAMRQSEHRKRRQAAQARELGPRLPGAPRGGV